MADCCCWSVGFHFAGEEPSTSSFQYQRSCLLGIYRTSAEFYFDCAISLPCTFYTGSPRLVRSRSFISFPLAGALFSNTLVLLALGSTLFTTSRPTSGEQGRGTVTTLGEGE